MGACPIYATCSSGWASRKQSRIVVCDCIAVAPNSSCRKVCVCPMTSDSGTLLTCISSYALRTLIWHHEVRRGRLTRKSWSD